MINKTYSKSLAAAPLSPAVLEMVNQRLMENYVIMPLDFNDATGILTVVTSKYQNVLSNLDLLTRLIKKENPGISGLDVMEVTFDNFTSGFNSHYHREFTLSSQDNTANANKTGPSTIQTKQANDILAAAISKNASDIHIIPTRKGTIIKFRIDGKLYDQDISISPEDEQMIVRIYKRTAGLDVNNLIPQDGHFNFEGRDIRFNSIPYGGEGTRSKIAMRISGSDERIPNLEQLNFSKEEALLLTKLALKPNGIFLVCGPTSEGKSTTLYSLIRLIQTTKNKIILTFEDPIEKFIDGTAQSQIRFADDEANRYTFAKGLRASLRQDPDVIQVGEIRDTETALISVQASQTGHLILSTLHVRNSITVFKRLADIGANVNSFVEQIVGIASQRLISVLCPHCKEKIISPLNPLLREQDRKMLEEGKYSYVSKGCEHCNGTGIGGRIPIIEIIEFNNYLRDFFSEKHGLIEIEKFLRNNTGFRSLWDKGMAHVAAGEVSLEELLDSLEVDADLGKD